MVLKKALNFVTYSLTPKAMSSPKADDVRSPKASAWTNHTPESNTSTRSPNSTRSSSDQSNRKRQQEFELDEFNCYDEEEKTQSYASEDEQDETEGSNVDNDLIEISLANDEPAGQRSHNQQHGSHSPHYNHHMRHYHTASDLETIDELIELAKDGNVQSFRAVCESLGTRRVRADSPGYMGWTPAHWAAREGHVPILEYLLSAGVSLDARDRKGDSLLHKAAANGQYRTCQWLLQIGFSAHVKNNNGKSALDVAQEHLAMERSSEAKQCEAILARENVSAF